MIGRLRIKFAQFLDSRHPDWCWADICTYVGMGWQDGIAWLWREKNKAAAMEACFRDCDRNGSCWCGKIRKP